MSAGYQASLPGLVGHGASRPEAVRALRRSVELALAARDRFWTAPENRAGRQRPVVAAGIGPYGAFLADGSEYTGDYDLGARGLARFHRRRLRILADCGADLLACETLPSAVEARVLVDLLEDIPGARAWLSFSCRDGERISDGTPLAQVAAEITGSDRIAAIGVNCTPPRWIGPPVTAKVSSAWRDDEVKFRLAMPTVDGARIAPKDILKNGGWAPGPVLEMRDETDTVVGRVKFDDG